MNKPIKVNVRSVLETGGILIGSLGLLIATGTDAVAVIGRHGNFSLLGSIEVVQAAIVLLAAASMVYATSRGEHATIHFLTDRLSDGKSAALVKLSSLISACFCLLLVVGCIWVSIESWSGYERSELLHIPYKWLRLVLIFAIGVMVGCFFSRCWRGARS